MICIFISKVSWEFIARLLRLLLLQKQSIVRDMHNKTTWAIHCQVNRICKTGVFIAWSKPTSANPLVTRFIVWSSILLVCSWSWILLSDQVELQTEILHPCYARQSWKWWNARGSVFITRKNFKRLSLQVHTQWNTKSSNFLRLRRDSKN